MTNLLCRMHSRMVGKPLVRNSEVAVLFAALLGIGLNFFAAFEQPIDELQIERPYAPNMLVAAVQARESDRTLHISQWMSP